MKPRSKIKVDKVKIRSELQRRGLSIRKLAQFCRVDHTFLCRVINGHSPLPERFIKPIEEILYIKILIQETEHTTDGKVYGVTRYMPEKIKTPPTKTGPQTSL